MSSPMAFATRSTALVGHLRTGQYFHLLTPVIERRLLTDDRLHAADSGRELRVLDIQLHIGGKLTRVTVRAQIVRARQVDRPHGRQNGFRAHLPILSLGAAATRKTSLVGGWDGKLQQLAEGCCTRAMHGRTNCHLGSLQIEASALAALLEDHAEELV
jgi:hypothetical protein